MKKLKKLGAFSCAALIALLILATCDDGSGGELLGAEVPSRVKLNVKGQRILITSWSEQGVDPRITMGYVLEDGTPLIDHVVQLYGTALRGDTVNCRADPKRPWCNEVNKLHICPGIDFLYERMYKNYDTTVRPVREKGIKYLINIIPGSVPVGILYRWPVEEWYPWNEITGDTKYPYGKDAVAYVMDQLQAEYDIRPFDGLAYDEEYGWGFRTGTVNNAETELSGYPDKYSRANHGQAWRISAENLVRFAHEANVKIMGDRYIKREKEGGGFTYEVKPRRQADGSWDKNLNGYDIFENAKFAPIPAKDWVFKQDEWNDPVTRKAMQAEREQSTHRLIFESYEIHAGAWLSSAPSYTYPTDPNDPSYDDRWPGLTILRNDLIDRSYNASYGGFSPGGWAGAHRFGPMSLDLGFNELAPKPPVGEGGGAGIIPRTKEFLQGNYGVIMFYCMTSRAYTIAKKGDNYFGPNQTPVEVHLSDMTKILFDQKVKYIETRDYDGDLN